jgi:hypothetical protein
VHVRAKHNSSKHPGHHYAQTLWMPKTPLLAKKKKKQKKQKSFNPEFYL